MKIFFFIFIIGFQSFSLLAQTPIEKEKIREACNQTYLLELQKKLFQKSTKDKKFAIKQAKINKWPLTINSSDGSYLELMKVVDGKPIYYTTYNADAAISTRANFMHNGGGLGLSIEGQGMEAHVWDGGLARSTTSRI